MICVYTFRSRCVLISYESLKTFAEDGELFNRISR